MVGETDLILKRLDELVHVLHPLWQTQPHNVYPDGSRVVASPADDDPISIVGNVVVQWRDEDRVGLDV